MALGELEEGVVPGEVDVEGSAGVVVLGPFVEELSAVFGLAPFEKTWATEWEASALSGRVLREASASRRDSSRMPDSWCAKA